MTVISAFLISIETFYLVKKTNKNKEFREKNRTFVDSEIVKICDELNLSFGIEFHNRCRKSEFWRHV
jgi:hypothetical protein